jgi:membrane-bound lytic murein transglycosylase MltF
MTSARAVAAVGVAILILAASPSAQQKPAPQQPAAGQAPAPAAAKPASQAPAQPRALSTDPLLKPWTGDFDGMLERRRVRVLAPYSRTFFFNELGRERGYAADLVRLFEKYMNTKLAAQLGKRPLTVVIIPTTRDKLLSGIAAGFGDIAVGNLTVTDERKKIVDFVTAPDSLKMSEVVLTGPKSPVIATADDLSGKTVHVRPSSSYHESLVALNERFKKAGKPAVTLVSVPDALEDEDMMEMLNLGLFEAIVVDDMVANMWAPILPKVKVNKGAVLRAGAVSGWAIRKNSPKLQAAVLEAYVESVQKTPKNLSDRLARYSGRVRQLQDPTGSADYKRFEATIALFRKYGQQYGFDPVMLAAQGFQESMLNQEARSPVGAIGLMQVMPATGKELGVGDITVADSNVHAGTKYMDQLMTKTFPDARFDELNRALFAFAAYNCGPGNMAKLRKTAAERGLDPNVWFNNVEIITAEKIGIETTTYVRNIYKYYVSYKLMMAAKDAQKAAREAVKK